MTAETPDTPDSPEGRDQLMAMMSPLKSMELQIGEHVFEALQHENTVGVLSFVSVAGGEQRITSVPLDAALLSRVQELLLQSNVKQSPRVPCIGFHCPRPIEGELDQKED